VKLNPDWHSAASGLLPGLEGDQKAKYGFIAVSILGATKSPYLM
jgi:Mn2+/Fe2+ NRAMP family transporter